MEWVEPLLFFITAALGAAINSVAGGGSFLLFPVLIFGGMSPVAANVMCTIALWPGSVASSIAYWRALKTPLSVLKYLLILCVIGSAFGAWVLLYLPESVFEQLVPWLLLMATLLFAFGRRLIGLLRLEDVSTNKVGVWIGMIVIAVYGGYFGAGIGILMLAMLQLAGYSHMHEMNAMKTVLGSAINAVAMVIFICSGAVLWDTAGWLVAGGITGGFIGAKMALRVSPEKVRNIVIIIGVLMTSYFFLTKP